MNDLHISSDRPAQTFLVRGFRDRRPWPLEASVPGWIDIESPIFRSLQIGRLAVIRKVKKGIDKQFGMSLVSDKHWQEKRPV